MEAARENLTNIHYLNYIVKEEESGGEILYFLREKMMLTTRKIRALKRESCGILLDGIPVTVRAKAQKGQKVQAMLNESENGSFPDTGRILPTDMNLSVLYEDEDLLFVNKPPGLVCHPSKGHRTDTLCNGICGYFKKTEQNAGIHLFGRLDKDTSGIVGIAKNKVTAERMTAQRLRGQFRKEYLALVWGCPSPKTGTIDIVMEEDRSSGYLKMRQGTGEGAKPAVTHYTVIKSDISAANLSGLDLPGLPGGRPGHQPQTHMSLCLITIETGRTHQIRFHMSAMGCPLVGDALYGGAESCDEAISEGGMLYAGYEVSGSAASQNITRAALHAYRVSFIHPFTEQEITLAAALPEDMRSVAETLKPMGK